MSFRQCHFQSPKYIVNMKMRIYCPIWHSFLKAWCCYAGTEICGFGKLIIEKCFSRKIKFYSHCSCYVSIYLNVGSHFGFVMAWTNGTYNHRKTFLKFICWLNKYRKFSDIERRKRYIAYQYIGVLHQYNWIFYIRSAEMHKNGCRQRKWSGS